MPQFSTHESVSLEKSVEINGDILETNQEDIDNVYEVKRCAEWISSNGFQRVCLQFPDHLLPDSSEVAIRLQNILGQTVYILGDTAYESCCIDYIAGAHVEADAIVHFGPICFSKTSANVPYLNIYEKHSLDATQLKEAFLKIFSNRVKDVVLLLDDGFIHHYDIITSIFNDQNDLKIYKIDDELILDNKTVVFVGKKQRKLLNIDLNFKTKALYYCDPDQKEIKQYKLDPKVVKRRYFLVEKIKDAQTIGIVVGTLGVKNFLTIIDRVKKLASNSGKKYYLISVGKPTVAKLANFPEIDIYVIITCSMNEIYDSREFYKPVVMPFDIEMALNNTREDLQFSYDYNKYLSSLEDIDIITRNDKETDVSLLTGKIRSNVPEQENHDNITSDSQVAIRPEGTLALNSNFGAGFLHERSWKGLEQNLGQTEVQMAEEGRKGIAQGYENEKS